MIFVSVGTNEARFDRLLRAVGALALGEEIVVQHGHSAPVERDGIENVDFLSFEAMTENVRQARVVLTHAGVGSVLVCLANGKRPVVVPRREAYGEAVDDHQLQLARRLAEAGFVTLVEAPEQIREVLARDHATAAVVPGAGSLAVELKQFLDEAIARPPAHTGIS